MKSKANHKFHRTILVSFLLIGILIWTGCGSGGGGGGEAPPQPGGNNQPQPPQPEPAPDLTISAIEVFPGQPQARQQFAVNVYVKNIGQAKSGDYDVAISIKDVSRGSTYPVGTFRNKGLNPGENVTAYTSTNRLVDDPGSYQVHVEIQPFQFEDGITNNNTLIWAFTVK